jgi:hypothetical protein
VGILLSVGRPPVPRLATAAQSPVKYRRGAKTACGVAIFTTFRETDFLFLHTEMGPAKNKYEAEPPAASQKLPIARVVYEGGRKKTAWQKTAHCGKRCSASPRNLNGGFYVPVAGRPSACKAYTSCCLKPKYVLLAAPVTAKCTETAGYKA